MRCLEAEPVFGGCSLSESEHIEIGARFLVGVGVPGISLKDAKARAFRLGV